jgi:MFS family permease
MKGMISSAFLWGFLSDVLGRKKLLAYGYILNGFFNILCSFSQSYGVILVFKFIGGFM